MWELSLISAMDHVMAFLNVMMHHITIPLIIPAIFVPKIVANAHLMKISMVIRYIVQNVRPITSLIELISFVMGFPFAHPIIITILQIIYVITALITAKLANTMIAILIMIASHVNRVMIISSAIHQMVLAILYLNATVLFIINLLIISVINAQIIVLNVP
jgi:hypothetical protein